MQLGAALGASLQHMFVGFGLALAIAIPLGILMGRIPRLEALLDPVVNALYAIPSVAFVPFLIIWFGLFYESRVALVFIMSFPDLLELGRAHVGTPVTHEQLVCSLLNEN